MAKIHWSLSHLTSVPSNTEIKFTTYCCGLSKPICIKALTKVVQTQLSSSLRRRQTFYTIDMELSGKMALVTGASSGIGLESARALLRNGVKRVAMLNLNEEKGRKAERELCAQNGPGSAVFIRTDVSKKEHLEAGFQAAVELFKGLDIVVNNAGIADDSHWELEVAINLNAVITGSLLAFKHMGLDSGGKGGVVVNVSSTLGLAPLAGMPMYVATKHAVIGFTRSLGMPFHMDRTGVRVMALCPGVTETPMIVGARNRQLDYDWGTAAAKELKTHPIQKPEEVAASLIHILKHGKNGSVWVSEGDDPVYEVAFPERKAMRVTN